jgi:BON domain
MDKATRKRGQQTLNELVRTLDAFRAQIAKRIDEIDIDEMGKRGTRVAGSMQKEVGRRVRPRRRGPHPAAMVGIAGLVLAGIAIAGAGIALYDRERREEARRRLTGMQSRARERYAELTGARSQAENELQARVREAIAAGGASDGLEIVVEGRTVYLRGLVSDPATADAAADRAHQVPGVVAVVNLTTSGNRSPAESATGRSKS